VSDLDQAFGVNYNVPSHLIKSLFDRLQPSAPIKLTALKSIENLGSNAIGKKSLAHLPVPPSKGKAVADPVSPIPSPQSTSIIGEFQETMQEFQLRLNALKGPCVVRQSNWTLDFQVSHL